MSLPEGYSEIYLQSYDNSNPVQYAVKWWYEGIDYGTVDGASQIMQSAKASTLQSEAVTRRRFAKATRAGAGPFNAHKT